jgi:hypothetical protein
LEEKGDVIAAGLTRAHNLLKIEWVLGKGDKSDEENLASSELIEGCLLKTRKILYNIYINKPITSPRNDVIKHHKVPQLPTDIPSVVITVHPLYIVSTNEREQQLVQDRNFGPSHGH